MQKKYFIGIDVGGTKISAALVTNTGEILSRSKHPTPHDAPGKEILKVIVRTVHDVYYDHSSKKLAGIGIGIPGIADPKTHAVIVTPNIKLAGFPLKSALAKKFRTKVFIDNDVNCGLLGEQWLGAAQKAKHVIGLFPGTGVGGAILIDGRLVTGAQGAAAEIGHMTIDLNGPMCSCGNQGCLEALASRWAIQRDIQAAIKSGKKSLITELTKNYLSVIKSKALKEALRMKDPVVTEVMTRVANILGRGCLSINHIFNPEMIVLGGGVIEACGEFLIPRIKQVVASDPFFKKFKSCQIVEAKLKDDAVILGAVALARHHV
jgi:glucokinase